MQHTSGSSLRKRCWPALYSVGRRSSLYSALILILGLILSGCGAGSTSSNVTSVPAAATNAPGGSAPTPTAVPPDLPTSVPSAAPTATSAPSASATTGATATTAATATTGATATTATTATTGATATTAATTVARIPDEIFYLSEGVLTALDPQGGAQRSLADEVSAFAATADGQRLALVRGTGVEAEIWLIERSGANLQRLTSNQQVEAGLSWAPDGQSLAYVAAAAARPVVPDWQGWSLWCDEAEVRVIELDPAGATISGEQVIGTGCDPAFSPDGRRIAFATPPTQTAPGGNFPGTVNAIRIVNRQGANGWDVARAGLSDAGQAGLLVYGPAWSPDGTQIAYQRFVGYQALVDLNMTEASSSFERRGEPLGIGAGWMMTPVYAPDGRMLAVSDYDYSDARGFSGYDVWSTSLLDLNLTEEMVLPSATLTMQAHKAQALAWATAAAWAPEGDDRAVALPLGWRAGLKLREPTFPTPGPAELWRWSPGSEPTTRLATGLDYGTPLLWLPALAGG